MTPEELVEIEAIKRVKYAYARCLDTKAWDELADLLTADVVADYSGGSYHFEGRDELLAFLGDSMGADTFHSSHRMHHPEIDLAGPAEATGTWALEDTVIDLAWDITIRGAAFYHDRYRKDDDGSWRIAETGYHRTFEEASHAAPSQDCALLRRGGPRAAAATWPADG